MNTATERLIEALNDRIASAEKILCDFATKISSNPSTAWVALEWSSTAFYEAAIIRAHSTAVSVITNQSVEAALTFCTDRVMEAALNGNRKTGPSGIIEAEIAKVYADLVARLTAHINFHAAKQTPGTA